ncbi:hypothetical protein [Halopiger goleimassiliensis]|uniref:hypothetical protein n=1 Tax=Halopiger goleimassiliensis TaxID=1293048 RepID=UPI000677BA8A|nr:hypothetical protein [Halopiger goleimassiliensis]
MVRRFLYPLGVWALMAVMAVLNGVTRELFIVPRTETYTAHVVSTAALIVVVLAIAYSFFATTTIDYRFTELVGIGVLWAALTVGFEFVVGYLEGTPPAVTIGQYDVLAGQVWILVPVTLVLAPIVFGTFVAD